MRFQLSSFEQGGEDFGGLGALTPGEKYEIEQQQRKVKDEIRKNYVNGKPTAELFCKLQTLFMELDYGENYYALQKVNHLEQIIEIVQKNDLLSDLFKNGKPTNADVNLHTLGLYNTSQMGRPDVVTIGIGRDFSESLLATDYGKTLVSGLEMPFPGPFAIRLPKGYSLLDARTSKTWRPLELISVVPFHTPARLVRAGDRRFDNCQLHGAIVEFRTGIGADIDPASAATLLYFSAKRDDGEAVPFTLDDIKEPSNPGWGYKASFTNDKGDRYEFSAEELVGLVYGTLLYLNTHNPSLVRVSNRKPVTPAELVPPPSNKKPTRIVQRAGAQWPTAIITEDVEELPREAYKHLVRGHYRNQPYGPRNSLRRLTWIKPFIRNKSGPGGTPRGDYSIE